MATKPEFLVAKEKMLVALATVSVAISSPAYHISFFYFCVTLLGERSKRLFKMPAGDMNYNRKYYQNTFLSATRAMSDYLLKPRYQ